MTDRAETSNRGARSVGRSMIAGLLVILIALPAPTAIAAEDDLLRIQLQEGQSLRDLAEQHLGDPDLWAEILRANGLTVADVRPGIELTIPVGPDRGRQPRASTRPCSASRAPPSRAPGCSRRSRSPRRSACATRPSRSARPGEWDAAAELATDATASAEEALAAALGQRDAAAEALLSDRQGWVEGQRPQDLLWDERPLNAVLIEEEKVRTLSRSTAQITFRDDSRLRLNANSQAVIQRMRVDPLSREEEAKVSLIEGDFYALLAGRSERKSFELEIPEVETEIEFDQLLGAARRQRLEVRQLRRAAAAGDRPGRERQPRSQRGGAGARRRAAEREGRRAAGAGAARAGRRPGRVRRRCGAELGHGRGRRGLLARGGGGPRLPAHDLQPLGADRRAATAATPLDVGTYYWRVAALDKFGLPGERSEIWRFHVRADATPPYLSIGTPGEGGILRQSPIELRGESEPERDARARRPAARGRRRRPLPDRLRRPSGTEPADRQGDRCRRQRHRAVALLRLHAGRARRGGVRRGPGPAGPAALRDRGRCDVDQRQHQPRCPDRGARGRRRRARLGLRRWRRAVRHQCADAGRRRDLRDAGDRAVGVCQRAAVRDQRSTARRRGSSSSCRRPRSPRSNGCRSGAWSRAAWSCWSTASPRS